MTRAMQQSNQPAKLGKHQRIKYLANTVCYKAPTKYRR